MPGIDDGLGKKAEAKIREWLDRPEEGYCFDRIPDQLSGFIGSKNICDFTLYKKPSMYYIESKATFHDRFDFSMLTEFQYTEMVKKSRIDGVKAVIIVLFASYKRAFIIDIREIERLINSGTKSLNIKKLSKWDCKWKEIKTVPSRKQLLDYTGEFDETSSD